MFVFREIGNAVFLKCPFWDSHFCLITDEFEYAELDGAVHFCFEPEIPYLDKFGQIKIVYFSWNLASRLTFFRSRPEISLGLKLKVVYWRWNLVYSLIWIC